MSLLNTKTTIFTEFENILFDTDTFVLSQLYLAYKDDDTEDNPFSTLVNLVEIHGFENIKMFGQSKYHVNPLMDYLNPNIIENREEMANEIYDSILYGDYDYTIAFRDLQETRIGESILELLVDSNLSELVIYCRNITNAVLGFIREWCDNDARVNIIIGNKHKFLTSEYCDNYFLSHYEDYKYLALLPRENMDYFRIDVIIPKFMYNMDEDDNLLSDDITPADMLETYHVNINTAELPIV